MLILKKKINPAALLKTERWAAGEGVERTVIRSQKIRNDGRTDSEIAAEMVRGARIYMHFKCEQTGFSK